MVKSVILAVAAALAFVSIPAAAQETNDVKGYLAESFGIIYQPPAADGMSCKQDVSTPVKTVASDTGTFRLSCKAEVKAGGQTSVVVVGWHPKQLPAPQQQQSSRTLFIRTLAIWQAQASKVPIVPSNRMKWNTVSKDEKGELIEAVFTLGEKNIPFHYYVMYLAVSPDYDVYVMVHDGFQNRQAAIKQIVLEYASRMSWPALESIASASNPPPVQ